MNDSYKINNKKEIEITVLLDGQTVHRGSVSEFEKITFNIQNGFLIGIDRRMSEKPQVN